jgi:hypothetical protein
VNGLNSQNKCCIFNSNKNKKMHIKTYIAGFVILYLVLIGWVVYEWINAPMIDKEIEELDK